MLGINATSPVIKDIHADINSSLKDLWFNNLFEYEFTVTDNEFGTRIKKLFMESELTISNSRLALKDTALSKYLGAYVLYLWGKTSEFVFDSIRELFDVDYCPFALLHIGDVSFIVANCDGQEYCDSVRWTCKVFQVNWQFGVYEWSELFIRGDPDYDRYMDFVLDEIYIKHDIQVN